MEQLVVVKEYEYHVLPSFLTSASVSGYSHPTLEYKHTGTVYSYHNQTTDGLKGVDRGGHFFSKNPWYDDAMVDKTAEIVGIHMTATSPYDSQKCWT